MIWLDAIGRLVGYRFKYICPLVGPGTIGCMPSVGVFLRDPNTYVSEFQRIALKTPNGEVDNSDRESNPPPPVYQF